MARLEGKEHQPHHYNIDQPEQAQIGDRGRHLLRIGSVDHLAQGGRAEVKGCELVKLRRILRLGRSRIGPAGRATGRIAKGMADHRRHKGIAAVQPGGRAQFGMRGQHSHCRRGRGIGIGGQCRQRGACGGLDPDKNRALQVVGELQRLQIRDPDQPDRQRHSQQLNRPKHGDGETRNHHGATLAACKSLPDQMGRGRCPGKVRYALPARLRLKSGARAGQIRHIIPSTIPAP